MRKETDFADYDHFYRLGVFDRCNGKSALYNRDPDDIAVCAYFDAYDGNEVAIEQPTEELEIEFTPEERHKVVVYYTGDDLIECVFDEGGQIIAAWSPNDANWRNEYFSGFLSHFGLDIVDGDEEIHDRPARLYAMEVWGLSAEEVGLDDE